MIDTCSYLLRDLHQMLRSKELSCVELMQDYMIRIKKFNHKTNALHQVDEDRLIKEAQHYDKQIQKSYFQGPLHGIPVSIKDNIVTQGIPTTAGIKEFKESVPMVNATVVQRLKAAGAIVLGKTNTPDLALSWNTDSTAYGSTKNPYNLELSPGGSSGGEAAAIASGCSPFGIGNDCGGSIRLPCHYCGIAGLRPSLGAIPGTGLAPPQEGGFPAAIVGPISVMGPMARFVEDIAYVMPLLCGPDYVDPNVFSAPLIINTNSPLANLRVAFYYHDGMHEADVATQNCLADVVEKLSPLCAQIKHARPSPIAQAWNLFFDLFSCEEGDGNQQFLAEHNIQIPANHLTYLFARFKGQRKSIDTFLALWTKWDYYRSQMLAFMRDYDAMLTFVMPHAATPLGDIVTGPTSDITRVNNLVAYSLLGWPVATVRIGCTDTGLPIGLQIIAKHWDDAIVLSLAKTIESISGGWQPPSFHTIADEVSSTHFAN